MLKLSCHCGQVHINLSAPPEYINECNCTLCSKTGVRWAYFDPAQVTVTGATASYCRTDKAQPGSDIHFCARCGSATHFTLTENIVARFGNTIMGVNMRLAAEQDLAGIELRFPDGLAWPGEGEFGYVQEARILGRRARD